MIWRELGVQPLQYLVRNTNNHLYCVRKEWVTESVFTVWTNNLHNRKKIHTKSPACTGHVVFMDWSRSIGAPCWSKSVKMNTVFFSNECVSMSGIATCIPLTRKAAKNCIECRWNYRKVQSEEDNKVRIWAAGVKVCAHCEWCEPDRWLSVPRANKQKRNLAKWMLCWIEFYKIDSLKIMRIL